MHWQLATGGRVSHSYFLSCLPSVRVVLLTSRSFGVQTIRHVSTTLLSFSFPPAIRFGLLNEQGTLMASDIPSVVIWRPCYRLGLDPSSTQRVARRGRRWCALVKPSPKAPLRCQKPGSKGREFWPNSLSLALWQSRDISNATRKVEWASLRRCLFF